jgi:hypothetical protein
VPSCSAASFFRFPWPAERHDYRDALAKSILFFEGQRSGRLPPGQRASWRGDSGVSDGAAAGVDLEGGYYDAGDNVKFGFPMAFTTTMLAWSVIEFGDSMPRDERRHAAAAVRWATDYLLKTLAHPGVIFLQASARHCCARTATFVHVALAAEQGVAEKKCCARAMHAGGRSVEGSRLLGEAGGHGHGPHGVQRQRGAPGLGHRGGDGGGTGGRVHGVPR